MSGYMQRVAKYLDVPSILHVRRPVTKRDVQKFHCDSVTHLIAISTRITDNLISSGISPEKITRIDDGVDVEFFSPGKIRNNVLCEQFSLNGHVLIGIIGRIDEFKRQLDFLLASKEVLKQCNNSVMFFVIGDVHSNTYFRKMRKFLRDAGLENHVRFTGRRDDMHEIMASLDILVSLSGGSIMFEAMAAGKAVISAGFTPRKYSYHIQDGKTGLLVESKEPADLAAAITKLVDTPQLRNQIGNEARQWALKELTHTKMAAKTQEVYADLLGREGANDNQNKKQADNQ
jgi:glycosyltransferase involved in cell wall biosynthesis